MPSVQGKPVIRIAPNNPVFDLPVIVGIEEGLFEAAGLDVALLGDLCRPREGQRRAPDHVAAQGEAVRLRLRRQLQRLRMGEHRPAGARHARRQHRGAARGGGGAGDPDVRRSAAGAARPRRRAGRGAGAHRLALLHAADARKRGRRRARQDRAAAGCRRCAGRRSRTGPIRVVDA